MKLTTITLASAFVLSSTCAFAAETAGTSNRLIKRASPRPPPPTEPKHQEKSCGDSSGAWWKLTPGCVQFRKPSCIVHSRADREGYDCARRRSRLLGQPCMSVSRSRESTIRRHTASMARALTWLKNTSPGSAAPRSVSSIISLGPIFSSTRKSPHGASNRKVSNGD